MPYGKKNLDPRIDGGVPVANLATSGKLTLEVLKGVNAELLAKVLATPEMAALLSSMAGAMGGNIRNAGFLPGIFRSN